MTVPFAHVSAEQLGLLAERVLPVDEATIAEGHLVECESCQATYDTLLAVPAILASIPPPSAPVDVTARVVAAIERESMARAAVGDGVHSLDEARTRAKTKLSTQPATPPRRRRFVAAFGAALLGSAAVLGGGYLFLSQGFLGSGADSPDSRGQAEEYAGGSGDSEGGADSASGGAHAPTMATAGREYTRATLVDDVRALLAGAVVTEDDEGGAERETTRAPAPAEGGEVVALNTCVAAVQAQAGTNAVPVATDVGTYEGIPAVIVVFADQNALPRDEVEVWVVAAGCGTSDGTGGGQLEVLVQDSVRR
jgi:hypothetical protein